MQIFWRTNFLHRILLCILILLSVKRSSTIGLHYSSDNDHELVEKVYQLRSAQKGVVVLITKMRFDGAGSEIAPMIIAAAYAQHRGWIYGGSIRGPYDENVALDDSHGADISELVKFVFGENMVFPLSEINSLVKVGLNVFTANYLERYRGKVFRHLGEIVGPPWPGDIIWLNETNLHAVSANRLPHVYFTIPESESIDYDEHGKPYRVRNWYAKLDTIVTEKFLDVLRQRNALETDDRELLFAPGRLSVALHVRRGRDVDKNNTFYHAGPKLLVRYTPDEYYFDLVEKIRAVFPDADVHAFSSLEEKTTAASFQGYVDRGIKVHFEDTVSIKQTWANMIRAHIFIMARSSFSFVPALLNRNCVVYDLYDLEARKMARWKTARDMKPASIRSCYS